MDPRQAAPPFRPFGYGFLLGFLIFLMGALVEVLLQRNGISGIWGLVDNGVTALVCGLLVFAYERQRYRNVTRKLRMIEAMNHHIRNALQSIVFAPYSPGQADQLHIVRNSIDRIQWALREVLPNESDNPPQEP